MHKLAWYICDYVILKGATKYFLGKNLVRQQYDSPLKMKFSKNVCTRKTLIFSKDEFLI